MTSKKPTPWIQRLIILHLGLLPTANDSSELESDEPRRGDFDESSSLEELCEHILYYFDYDLHSANVGVKKDSFSLNWRDEIVDTFGDTDGIDCTVNESAVKFSGLCRALYSLPKSLQQTIPGNKDNGENVHNKTSSISSSSPKQIVTMTTCCLVFVCPDPNRNDIIAVAQIPRVGLLQTTSQNSKRKAKGLRNRVDDEMNNNVSSLGANPHAVERIIRKCHSLFELTRGGSIHSRLLKVDDFALSLISANNENGNQNGSIRRQSNESYFSKTSTSSDFRGSINGGLGGRKMSLITNTKSTKRLSGSILRFSQTKDSNTPNSQNSGRRYTGSGSYPGMDKVYFYRKKIRKLSQSLEMDSYMSQNHNSSEHIETKEEDIKTELNQYQALLANLLDALPVTELRSDLRRYYNDIIALYVEKQEYGFCVGRCLIDMIPKPFPKLKGHSDSKKSQYLPTAPSPYETLVVSKMVRSLLQLNDASDPKYESRRIFRKEKSNAMFAISTFYNGRHIFTHKSSDSKINAYENSYSQTKSNLEEQAMRSIDISVETTCLLYEHFSISSQRDDNNEGNESFHSTVDELLPNSPLDMTLNALSFGNVFNDSGKSFATDKTPPPITFSKRNSFQTKGSYVTTPPSSNVSTAESLESVYVPVFGDVWLPCIFLFDYAKNDKSYKARAFMYNFGAFSFIFYVKDVLKDLRDSADLEEEPGESHHIKLVEVGKYSSFKSIRTDGGNGIGELLADIGVYISSLLSDLQNYQRISSPNDLFLMNYNENCLDFLKTSQTGKCGADVIFVDRNEHNLIILTERLPPYDRNNSGQNKISKSMSKKILSLDLLDKTSNITNSYEGNFFGRAKNIKMMYSEHIDCRHILAMHFPSNVILSFDDMFNEILRLRLENASDTNVISMNERILELCTFSPFGWMYARAHNERELYILFDSDIHVTLADVQKAASQIRCNVFNDALL